MSEQILDIAHVFRAPVGGLFRHVRDVVRVQAEAGHRLAVVCDASSGGAVADTWLAELAPMCAHGVHRLEMSRTPGLGDAITARRIAETLGGHRLDIIHGHGAKGGAYARIASGKLAAKAIYTPHGGVLHYDWTSAQGALFLGAERLMLTRTAGLAFVCAYEKETFADKVGLGGTPFRIIPNGLWPQDFAAVEPAGDASDILYIGEMRHLKGVDTLIEAIALVNDRPLTATLVGDGPDRAQFEDLAKRRGLDARIRFPGAMPAAQAFALGRLMVVPSRNESFPYIVLETIAAGKPMIATRVGGIPEVVEDEALVAPDDADQLAAAISRSCSDPERAIASAEARSTRVARDFSALAMGRQLIDFYQSVVSDRRRHARVA